MHLIIGTNDSECNDLRMRAYVVLYAVAPVSLYLLFGKKNAPVSFRNVLCVIDYSTFYLNSHASHF